MITIRVAPGRRGMRSEAERAYLACRDNGNHTVKPSDVMSLRSDGRYGCGELRFGLRWTPGHHAAPAVARAVPTGEGGGIRPGLTLAWLEEHGVTLALHDRRS